MITDEELLKLDALANQHGIPLVIDNAYGVRSRVSSSAKRARYGIEYRAVHESFQAGATAPAAALSSPMKIITAITNMNGIISGTGGIGPAMMCEND